MAANINDLFTKAGVKGGDYPTIATVSSARSMGETILTCDDLTGWSTDTSVHFSTFQVNANGEIIAGSQTDWKGIVVGNTITELTRVMGAEDSGNQPGDRVELNPTNAWLDDLVTGLLKSHNQDGTLKNDIILSQIFPVGIVIPTTTNKNPQTWLGGTWEPYAQGRTLVGVDPEDKDFNTAGKEGGAKTVTLTMDQMPKHSHTITTNPNQGNIHGDSVFCDGGGNGSFAHTDSAYTNTQGGSQPHNNLQPYKTVYYWHRTA